MLILFVLISFINYFFLVFTEQIKVSVNDFIIKAAAVTLKVSSVQNIPPFCFKTCNCNNNGTFCVHYLKCLIINKLFV